MTYVLEWSQSTNNFHIQKIQITASHNLKRFFDNLKPNDYHVIFSGTYEQCCNMADKYRHFINEREKNE